MKKSIIYWHTNEMGTARKRSIISHFFIFISYFSLLIAHLTLCASCSTIDDDLSQCGNDYEMDYELRLVTNMTTEMKMQLSTETEMNLAQALRTHLSDVFTDFAHDVDLSFYDT